jgi:hypothetical protein
MVSRMKSPPPHSTATDNSARASSGRTPPALAPARRAPLNCATRTSVTQECFTVSGQISCVHGECGRPRPTGSAPDTAHLCETVARGAFVSWAGCLQVDGAGRFAHRLRGAQRRRHPRHEPREAPGAEPQPRPQHLVRNIDTPQNIDVRRLILQTTCCAPGSDKHQVRQQCPRQLRRRWRGDVARRSGEQR